MSAARKVLPLAQLCTRHFSKSAGRCSKAAEAVEEVPSKAFGKLKERQKKFGVDDGVPVYLKGGFGDRALYLATSALVLIGLGFSGDALYRVVTK